MIFLAFRGQLSMIVFFYCGRPQISLGRISPLAFSSFRLKIDKERPLLVPLILWFSDKEDSTQI